MKKTILLILIITTLATTSIIHADIIEPGIENEFEYKEITFLSGKPVELLGKVKITQSGKGDSQKITYDYNLIGEDNSRLTRKVVYNTEEQKDVELKQTLTSTIFDPSAKINETITVDGKNYVLQDYIFNKSSTTQDKSIIKYTSGTWNGKKVYNEGGNKVIINIYGETYKYDNEWSTVETALIRQVITYEFPQAQSGTVQQSTGTINYGVTNIREKEIISQQSLPNQISFKESYVISEKEENTLTYNYDMPVITTTRTTKRNTGEGSLKLTTMPKLFPLPIPGYTDITGYWAEKDINRLFSLGVMTGDTRYFNPRTPINRAEFARALVKACGLEPEIETKKPKSRKEVQEDIIFLDVDPENPYYPYIKRIVELDIMKGTEYNTFSPEELLTKAQAVTIIIRALGLEDISTFNLGKTFADEMEIPDWARKSIYVAEDLKMIDTNEEKMIEPNKQLTRGEAANLINRLITYLQKEIKTDYRERVVNF